MITYAPKWIGVHERSARGQTRRGQPILPGSDVCYAPFITKNRPALQYVAKGQERSFKQVESELACLALSPLALSGKEADA